MTSSHKHTAASSIGLAGVIMGLTATLTTNYWGASICYMVVVIAVTYSRGLLFREVGTYKVMLSEATLRLSDHGDQVDLRRLTAHDTALLAAKGRY